MRRLAQANIVQVMGLSLEPEVIVVTERLEYGSLQVWPWLGPTGLAAVSSGRGIVPRRHGGGGYRQNASMRSADALCVCVCVCVFVCACVCMCVWMCMWVVGCGYGWLGARVAASATFLGGRTAAMLRLTCVILLRTISRHR